MKASEIRQMSDDEIRGAFEDAKVEMFNLRFQLASGSLEDTTRIKALRKDVARYLTVLREREIAAALVAEEGVNNAE